MATFLNLNRSLNRSMISSLVNFTLMLVFFLTQVELNHRVKLSEPRPPESASEILLRPDSGLVRALSFGHLSSVIDSTWIQAMAGDASIPGKDRAGRSQFDYDLDLMTDLDPALFQAYVGGAQFLSVVRDEPVAAKNLLMKGTHFLREKLPELGTGFRDRYWNRSWELWMTLGYVELFELGDMPQAAQAFTAASLESGAPAFLIHLGERLNTVDGQYDVGVRLIEFMTRSAAARQNEKKVAELELKKRNLVIGQYLYKINKEYGSYLKQRRTHSKKSPAQSWGKFLVETSRSEQDPWGGVLSVNSEGEIVSTTPHEIVFKLK